MIDLTSKSKFIFDLDNTIVKLKIDWAGWRRELGEVYRVFDPTFDLDKRGELVHFYINDFCKKYGKECRDKIVEFSERYEMENLNGLEPRQSVISIIHGLRGKRMYVWSSNCRATVEQSLKELGIFDKFERLVTKNDVFYIKPDPEGFSLIHDGSPLNEYVFFGDSSFDRGAAENIGVDYIDVATLA